MSKQYTSDVLMDILSIDSPTGFTGNLMTRLSEYADELGYSWYKNEKGNLLVEVPGQNSDKTIGLSAHGDTLGLMVRSISASGTLSFTKIGGPILPTLDGEYCKVQTRCGKIYTGTILSKSAAVHVFSDANSRARDEANMEIKLDEAVKNKEEVKKLGIQTGDFVFIDTKSQITETGFIKSRFLDDKLSVAILFGLLKRLKDRGEKPMYDTVVMITSYEETGHGLAHLPQNITELLAIDMGCIGDDLNCTEQDVSICVKDSSGPYDYGMTNKLIDLAKENNISFALDIYPFYGSDASAALRGGNNLKAALIGAGVANSHGMERSHVDGMMHTLELAYHYVMSK